MDRQSQFFLLKELLVYVFHSFQCSILSVGSANAKSNAKLQWLFQED